VFYANIVVVMMMMMKIIIKHHSNKKVEKVCFSKNKRACSKTPNLIAYNIVEGRGKKDNNKGKDNSLGGSAEIR